ncbi:hypothetical protein Tsubulata_025294 [Turnera subulata]|uniref:Aminotransferase-like plant mobile domain-containing protein n=1 Tax=Turnera subulata TaxID=218843 RepID=A0A9Q0FBZ3_9ROSI|nr:hypothetical protein Tsubulata_025294 [Turnera subulata]
MIAKQPIPQDRREDHFKFLIVFFTRYLFYSRGKECTLRFVPLVCHLLESNHPVALGPLLLTAIYRGLRELTTETPGELHFSANGPLWLVQIWIMASLPYLVNFRHTNLRLDGPKSYAYQFVLRPRNSADEVTDHPDFIAVWRSILVSRDLLTVLTVLRNEPRTSVEVYRPHYCIAQLGFHQLVSVPLVFSCNRLSSHARVPFSYSQEDKAPKLLSIHQNLRDSCALIQFSVQGSGQRMPSTSGVPGHKKRKGQSSTGSAPGSGASPLIEAGNPNPSSSKRSKRAYSRTSTAVLTPLIIPGSSLSS